MAEIKDLNKSPFICKQQYMPQKVYAHAKSKAELNRRLNKGEQIEKINLIEIICTEQSEKWYQELAQKIANHFSWEVIDV